MTSALIAVDVQKDFLPGGSLAVTDGFDVIDPLIVFGKSGWVDTVVFTQDYHDYYHIGHRTTANDPSHQPTFTDGDWPMHCVSGTRGAEIDQRLLDAFPDAPVFRKGMDVNVEAYSGFDGYLVGYEPDLTTSLAFWLGTQGVEVVYIGGLALDYCVKETVLDAFGEAGLSTTVLLDATRPVSYLGGVQAVAEFAHYDGSELHTSTVTQMLGG